MLVHKCVFFCFSRTHGCGNCRKNCSVQVKDQLKALFDFMTEIDAAGRLQGRLNALDRKSVV